MTSPDEPPQRDVEDCGLSTEEYQAYQAELRRRFLDAVSSTASQDE